MDSAIGEHLLTINSCRTSYEDDCFSVLHRARDKIHLKVLEAIYIAINRPPHSVQTIKQSYFKYFCGTVGDWGDLIFFFYLVSPIQLFNSNPVFKNVPVTKFDKCWTKGPSLFYCFRIVSPLFTNDFIIHFFID